MDNFTHSLAGWALSRAGLAKKTGLATATLVIAANLPDIDAFATLLGGHQHLAIRRGITHGPIAILMLPLLLTWAMIVFDGWQAQRDKRPAARLPIHKGWLLGLAYIGTLSHPALDYLNNYGIRLLEPFSSQWFYGDTLFIIDVWVWSALALGIWLSRRREKAEQDNWRNPAIISLAAVLVYIGTNGVISNRAENAGNTEYQRQKGEVPTIVIANAVPVRFWYRDVLIGDAQGFYSEAPFQFGRGLDWNNVRQINTHVPNVDYELLKAKNPDVAPLLFWARTPFAVVKEHDGKRSVTIGDARFSSALTADRFAVTTETGN
ncbi:metal-dependent hydrolase [Sphingorhabdus sp. Alg239-R122]|uniref:metal-dependent hydrolase n=1 Tax=Sphingorhabdus sp. Alg239-R122 TaxID=2305989 RepID=UPI0013DC7A6B|nr:metal-dependent hydrolase [Sphingorhabdus sp. Alg239-R122]